MSDGCWSDCWDERYGLPFRELECQDASPDYEMHRAHIFLMNSGKFVLVTESGCSCYDSSDADLEEFETLSAAKEAFDRFI